MNLTPLPPMNLLWIPFFRQIYFKLYQDDEDVITKYKYHKTIVDENVFKVSHYIDANYIEELINNT